LGFVHRLRRLTQIKETTDSRGKHAVFTPFAVPCNIDFERMAEEGYEEYRYELLPVTYEKLAAQRVNDEMRRRMKGKSGRQ